MIITTATILCDHWPKLTVKVPYIQPQNNGQDYGLFAIADMMEFATSSYKGLTEGKLEFEFLQSPMREDLVKVFQTEIHGTIPKTKDNAT